MSDCQRSNRPGVRHYGPLRPNCPMVYRPALAEAKLSHFEGISNRQTFRPQRSRKRVRNGSEIRAGLDEDSRVDRFRRQSGTRSCRCLEIVLPYTTPTDFMTRQQVLDLYFMDARSKLIDLAAFLDRLDRAEGEADFRLNGFHKAMQELGKTQPERARGVLLALSDTTTEPIPN